MNRRKTKIVCTLGPVTESAEGIASLLEAGMDVVRLNFSHGDREDHRQKIHRIREVSKSLGREVGNSPGPREAPRSGSVSFPGRAFISTRDRRWRSVSKGRRATESFP